MGTSLQALCWVKHARSPDHLHLLLESMRLAFSDARYHFSLLYRFNNLAILLPILLLLLFLFLVSSVKNTLRIEEKR